MDILNFTVIDSTFKEDSTLIILHYSGNLIGDAYVKIYENEGKKYCVISLSQTYKFAKYLSIDEEDIFYLIKEWVLTNGLGIDIDDIVWQQN